MSKEATVKIDKTKKTVTIVLPLQEPTPSVSGKTMVIATTRGNMQTDVEMNGKPVTIGVNCYFKKN